MNITIGISLVGLTLFSMRQVGVKELVTAKEIAMRFLRRQKARKEEK